MGKTFSRNQNDENYRGNMRNTRKENKQLRKERHKDDLAYEQNMEDVDHGEHSDNFRPRKNDWR